MTKPTLTVDNLLAAARQFAEDESRQTGYLTTASALHWQMRYSYVIDKADIVSGIQWLC